MNRKTLFLGAGLVAAAGVIWYAWTSSSGDTSVEKRVEAAPVETPPAQSAPVGEAVETTNPEPIADAASDETLDLADRHQRVFMWHVDTPYGTGQIYRQTVNSDGTMIYEVKFEYGTAYLNAESVGQPYPSKDAVMTPFGLGQLAGVREDGMHHVVFEFGHGYVNKESIGYALFKVNTKFGPGTVVGEKDGQYIVKLAFDGATATAYINPDTLTLPYKVPEDQYELNCAPAS